jgi:prolyl 4-hydroxylase
MGQRTFTFMIYLNDVEAGGETNFVNIKQGFRPLTGTAVIWNSLNQDGSPNSFTMHHALPVQKGFKAIITKWFRSSSIQSNPPPMFRKELNEFVPNYTKMGIKLSELPPKLFKEIDTFYEKNRQSSQDEVVEGDFIVSSTKGQNKRKTSSVLIDLSPKLREKIHDAMKPMMENWCGKKLKPTFVYGIREYQDKAILKSHRDRVETHIISAILNVAQEVDEDWPLIIDDNYYRSHRVMLKPGQVVFYEGARLTHGRPEAFNGKRFANIFCHFVPEDYEPVKF